MNFFKELISSAKAFFKSVSTWSTSTKIMAGICSVTAVVLIATTGLLIHDALSRNDDKTAEVEETEEEDEEPTVSFVDTQPVAEEPVVVESGTVKLPNFVACRVSGDSLEKDLTIFIKGNESGKKISGTKFEIKLIDPKNKDQISKYVSGIDEATSKIEKAQSDKTFEELSGKTVSDVMGDTAVAGVSPDTELTKGEVLLFEKEKSIEAYKTALSSIKGDTYTDSDSDGMIYIKEIKAGDYIACFMPKDDYDAVDYMTKVNVKDKVEYKKVESIADKTVSAAAAGDTQPAEAAQVEATLTDTVEFVESTKTPTGAGGGKSAPATLAPAAGANTTTEHEYTVATSKANGSGLSASSQTPWRGVAMAVANTSIEVTKGSSGTIGYTGVAEGNTVTAVSNNTGIATVGAAGGTITISGVEVGSTTVTVTETQTTTTVNPDTQAESTSTTTVATATINVTVKAAEQPKTNASMSTAGTMSLRVGATDALSVSGTGVNSITASSSNTGVAAVSVTGFAVRVTGVKAGTSVITIHGNAADGYNAPADITCTVTVTENTTVNKSTITVPSTVTLYAKEGINALTIAPTITNGTLKEAVSSDTNVFTPKISGANVVITGSTKVTSNASAKLTYTVICADNRTEYTASTTVNVIGSSNVIKDASGVDIFTDEACTKAATVADYNASGTFYKKGEASEYKYTGWQVINGNSFYYDKNGNVVTGTQVIQGVQYNFGSDGALLVSGTGIDVSKWQGNIDWSQTRSAVGFAIIRCGFRGSSGNLAIDEYFSRNASNAKANGVKIGLYIYSRATTEAQAVEEASLAIQCAQQAGGLSYPIYIDMEDSCQAGLSNEQRTAIINAFCATVRNSGYKAGVYANKNWLTNKINTGALQGASVWCAQYNTTCTYSGKKDIWQYSSKGSVPGISGNVDMNISYF